MQQDIVIPPQHDKDIELRFRLCGPPETVSELRARGLDVQRADSGQLFALETDSHGLRLIIPKEDK